MANGALKEHIPTGAVDFSGGVDSSRVRTIASAANPNGLQPNQLAWLANGTVREACISPRPGWRYHRTLPTDIYQCGYMYEPDFDLPYLMLQIGGRTYQVRVDTDNSVVDVTVAGSPNDGTIVQNWMEQAQQFLVIQDDVNPDPLVWDGTTLRRVSTMANSDPKIPRGSAMCFYMGRLWIAQGREWLGSDISPSDGFPSGTAPYAFRDACLSVRENTYLASLKRFVVPTVAGNIRAMIATTNLDTALGEGQFLVFTRKVVYSMNVVVERLQWAALKDPLQRVVQTVFGTTSDRSVVTINGDVFYQSTDGVRSFLQKSRDFNEYGNTPQSREVERAIQFNDRALLRFGTGIESDNRLLQSCLPFQTPYGVAHRGAVALNFDLVSTISRKLPPAWEGMWEGIDVLQYFRGDFGGRFRTFAVALGRTSGQLELWEQVAGLQEDEGPDGNNRITWIIETPSYTWGSPLQLKQLDTMRIWVDRMFGTVDFKVYYRPDQHPCWTFWHQWQECAARDNCELLSAAQPCDYPEQEYCPQYRNPMTLPTPHFKCDETNARPTSLGYSFQFRIIIKGYCRVRGIFPYANERDEARYEGIRCSNTGQASPAPAPTVVRAILDDEGNAILDDNGNPILQD